MKLHDQHVHTIYSADSMASLEEYYLKALALISPSISMFLSDYR